MCQPARQDGKGTTMHTNIKTVVNHNFDIEMQAANELLHRMTTNSRLMFEIHDDDEVEALRLKMCEIHKIQPAVLFRKTKVQAALHNYEGAAKITVSNEALIEAMDDMKAENTASDADILDTLINWYRLW